MPFLILTLLVLFFFLVFFLLILLWESPYNAPLFPQLLCDYPFHHSPLSPYYHYSPSFLPFINTVCTFRLHYLLVPPPPLYIYFPLLSYFSPPNFFFGWYTYI